MISLLSEVILLITGSWVVTSRVISRETIVIAIVYIRGLITPLITAHEPPSTYNPTY